MADRPTYRLDDYDYELPGRLIAQSPAPQRDRCRLLVLHRASGRLEHRSFRDLPDHLHAGDVLVLNDTRVVPARLLGRKDTGGRVELLVLDPYKDPDVGAREGYRCLLRASKPPRRGSRLFLEQGGMARVMGEVREGRVTVRFETGSPLLEILERAGRVPLPPYIRRNDDAVSLEDGRDYQTIYAAKPGAVAAPTAGLHFTKNLLGCLEEKGVETVRLTLHVGYGTFSPIRVEDIREHGIHAEWTEIGEEACQRIREARRGGRRVVAVGTTVVRALEYTAARFGEVSPFAGFCDHYIYPGFRFRVVDAMVTNFHLPKSSLILLVSAFAGRETILAAYAEAVRNEYRFYSYGDAMLIV